ncbi:MAG: hypothetical protein M1530_04350 [Candidatus Marsarchaeota archaeon]|nr:hypothetical protein [Candidatus Marsarchaeota archaeon]
MRKTNSTHRRGRAGGTEARRLRGQVVISDLIISMAVFLMLLVITYEAWNRQVERLGEWREQAGAQDALRRGLDALTRSPGHPYSWAVMNQTPNESGILALGAASSPGRVDALRMGMLAQWLNSSDYYNATRSKMGVSPYRAQASVRELDGSQLYSMGEAPGDGAIMLASGQRVALYENRTVLVRLSLWRNET